MYQDHWLAACANSSRISKEAARQRDKIGIQTIAKGGGLGCSCIPWDRGQLVFKLVCVNESRVCSKRRVYLTKRCNDVGQRIIDV